MTPVEVHIDGTSFVAFALYAMDKILQSETEHDVEHIEPINRTRPPFGELCKSLYELAKPGKVLAEQHTESTLKPNKTVKYLKGSQLPYVILD
ncbi:hypothetical protein BTVI_45029 [Pitangus sulphuratus]|nr:hypothetical protein BTVI_45029 [Pitangus sulphuratus]